jgi:hypothetical protein
MLRIIAKGYIAGKCEICESWLDADEHSVIIYRDEQDSKYNDSDTVNLCHQCYLEYKDEYDPEILTELDRLEKVTYE